MLEYSQLFPICKSMGFLFQTLKSSLLRRVHGPIMLNFELRPDLMVVLLTCKNEEDSIKIQRAGVFTTSNIDFSDTQGQLHETP